MGGFVSTWIDSGTLQDTLAHRSTSSLPITCLIVNGIGLPRGNSMLTLVKLFVDVNSCRPPRIFFD